MFGFNKKALLVVKLLVLTLILTSNNLFAWTGPTQAAPNGNVSAPLNVSADAQNKPGTLTLSNTVNALLIPSGRFGLGTNNPLYRLHAFNPVGSAIDLEARFQNLATNRRSMIVADSSTDGFGAGGARIDFRTHPNGYSETLFGNTMGGKAALIGISSGGTVIGEYAAQPLIFGTANAERMRITSAGNVGIGTNNPGFKLDVSGRIRLNPGSDPGSGIWLKNLSSNFSSYVGRANDADELTGFYSPNAGFGLIMKDNGNVGIGTPYPTAQLEVVDAAGSQVINIKTTGQIQTTGNDNSLGGVWFDANAQTISGKSHPGTKMVGAVWGESTSLGFWNNGKTSAIMDSNGKVRFPFGIQVNDGSQGAGKVLTSDENGNASWADPGQGTKGAYMQAYGNSGTYTFNKPAGVTNIVVEAAGAGAGAYRCTGVSCFCNWGGNGALAKGSYSVTSQAASYTVTVGNGGNSGASGGSSSFGNLLTAGGGTYTYGNTSNDNSLDSSTASGAQIVLKGRGGRKSSTCPSAGSTDAEDGWVIVTY